MPRTVFVDFEASSLSKRSWPVEVAWVFDDGAGEAHLIAPLPDWTDWADRAERIHRIGRDLLSREGEAPAIVAARMVEVLTGCALFATAPSWDGKWLSVLLRGGGQPRHALRLEDTTVAHRRAVRAVLSGAGVPADEHGRLVADILAEAARQREGAAAPAHRALADAEAELALWHRIQRLAEAAVAAR